VPQPAARTGHDDLAARRGGDEEPDAELLEIFLEEAREVVGNGLAALDTLAERARPTWPNSPRCAAPSTRSRAARAWSG
jgi:hypothetical protein